MWVGVKILSSRRVIVGTTFLPGALTDNFVSEHHHVACTDERVALSKIKFLLPPTYPAEKGTAGA